MEEKDKERIESYITHPELRLGYVCELYRGIAEGPVLKQLDLLDTWFPGLLIVVEESDGETKKTPVYDDVERMIKAVRYHDYIYSGGNNRITHITGRLIGTSSSNLEKERKTAELIQKNIARRLVNEMDPLPDLIDHISAVIDLLDEEKMQEFHYELYMFCLICAETYYQKDVYDRDNELFPFDEETFDQVIYNAFYQIQRYNFEGLVHGYLWLLLGSLLRNECGRVTRIYDSSFVPLYRQGSETGDLLDKLHFLFAPEDYYSYYTGDDLDRRFPGTEWYCDNCEAHLNEQEGFDDHLEAWQCRRCGYINRIGPDTLYENNEDCRNGIKRKDEQDHNNAIERRRKELEGES